MPYRTKPYTRFGLGQAFRAIEYVIDETRIREVGLISGNTRASIKRDGASVVRVDDNGSEITGLRSAVNFGNLLVTNSGVRHVFEKVPNIRDFISAVEGTHPDVQPPKSVEYENFVICIPQMPEIVDGALYSLTSNPLNYNKSYAQEGQHVRRGDPITSSYATLVSPVDGKLIKHGCPSAYAQWTKGADWPHYSDEIPATRDYFETRFKVQPVKETRNDYRDAITEAYKHVFSAIEKGYSNPQKLADKGYMSLDQVHDYIRKVHDEGLTILRNAKVRKEYLNTFSTSPDTDGPR